MEDGSKPSRGETMIATRHRWGELESWKWSPEGLDGFGVHWGLSTTIEGTSKEEKEMKLIQ